MQYGAHKRNVFVACQISNDILHNNVDNYLYFIYLKRSITLKSKHKNGFTETRNWKWHVKLITTRGMDMFIFLKRNIKDVDFM